MLVIILLEGSAGAVPAEEWNKTFGGGRPDRAESVKQTSDGGYILTGFTSSYGAGKADAWLIKTDKNGNEQWNKTFGGTEDDNAASVQQTTDSGYIVVGHTRRSPYAMGSDAWLIKTDANGNEMWNRTFGGKKDDYAFSVQQTPDDGYIIGGLTYSYGGVWLIKTDANGKELWNRTFGGGTYPSGQNDIIKLTIDGGYILVGKTGRYGGSDAWVIKTNAKGDKQWNITLGGTRFNEIYSVYSVQQTSDSGYIIAGEKAPKDDNFDSWLFKLDANGNLQWSKTYGGTEYDGARSVQQTSDSGYIFAGTTGSYGNAGPVVDVEGVVYYDDVQWDMWLLKTDPNGNEEWNQTFGVTGNDKADYVQQTKDGGYIFAGSTNFYGHRDDDAWLIKVSGERTEKAAGFEVVQTIAVLSAVYVFGRKYLRLN